MAYEKFKPKSFSSIPAEKIIAWIKKNFEFKTRKHETEYCINNPFDDDTGYNFNINPEKNKCHDWRGNEWAGPINPETGKRNCSFIKFVRLYKKVSYAQAISEVLGTNVDLRNYLNPKNRVTEETAKNLISVTLPEGVGPIIGSPDSQSKLLIRWLGERGYTKQDIADNDLQHLGMTVFWPYYEFDTLVYWQSRSRMNKKFNFPVLDVYDKDGKIIGQTDGTKGDFFYGFDDIEPASYVIITEAIFDKKTLGEQALASGGAILTPKQVGKLKILGPRKGVILSPDNDKAGIESIMSNSELIAPYGYPIFYSIPPKIEYVKDGERKITKDWNELGQYVCGFDRVRELHDEGIKKMSEKSLLELNGILDV